MLALRRLATARPLARSCSFMADLKSMEAAAGKLAPQMPASLQDLATQGAGITAEVSKFAAEKPDLYKAFLAKCAEADAPGIKATVDAPKDPSTCKYTEEGTMVHDIMTRVAKADRRMALISELEYTLTEADKAALLKTMEAKAAEAGVDAKFTTADVPSSISMSA